MTKLSRQKVILRNDMTDMIPIRLLSRTFRVYLYKLYVSLRMVFPAWSQVKIQYDRCGKIIMCMYNLATYVDNWLLIHGKLAVLIIAISKKCLLLSKKNIISVHFCLVQKRNPLWLSCHVWLLVIWVKWVQGGLWVTGELFVRMEPWNVERPWLLACPCFNRGFKELFQLWEIAFLKPHICSVMIDFRDKSSVSDLLSQISIEYESHRPIIWIMLPLPSDICLDPLSHFSKSICSKRASSTILEKPYLLVTHTNTSLNPPWCLIIRRCLCKLTKIHDWSWKKLLLLEILVYWVHCCLGFCVYICLK